MGREIRRVPKGWQHPQDESGAFIPLLDRTFKEDADEWVANCVAWADGTHEDFAKHGAEYPYYWQWDTEPPKEELFRPEHTSEPTCYQVYENVSEGTPASPVFESEEALVEWLIDQGHSRHAAEKFVESGYAPSMMVKPGGGAPPSVKMGIDIYDE